MKVCELLKSGQPTLSFEFFPPKTEGQEQKLYQVIAQLKEFQPDYVSVTYGALGTDSQKSFRWVREIKDNFKITPVAHLTCVADDRQVIESKVSQLVAMGVENILALRGDPPQIEKFVSPKNGCKHACELIAFLKQLYPNLCLGAAGYPEKHPECPDLESDLAYLKKKVEAGADYIVTQLFFDNRFYFNFVEKCRAIGIKVPIIPGLMPITSYKSIKKMSAMCGAAIPKSLLDKLEENQADKETVVKIGVEQTVKQCNELKAKGVPGLHFFVMNQAGPISQILQQL